MPDIIFQTVLNMTITAAVVTLLVLILRFTFKKLMPKTIVYVLWFIVLFRLLFPFSFTSTLSIFGVFDSPFGNANIINNEYEAVSDPIKEYPKPVFEQQKITNPFTYMPQTNNSTDNENLIKTVVETNSVNPVRIVYNMIPNAWIAGVSGFLLFAVITFLRVRSKLKLAYKYKKCELIERCKKRVGIRRNIRVFVSEHIESPIVAGFLRPKVILPVSCNEEDDSDIEKILVHELFHIKRFDNCTNAIFLLALCIHWFNPVIWLGYIMFRKDMELSCDERVISIFGDNEKAAYANTLIDFSIKQNRLINGAMLSFGESNIKTRVKGIMSFRKKGYMISVLAVLLVSISGLMLISNAKAKEISSASTTMQLGIKSNDKTAVGSKSARLYSEPFPRIIYYSSSERTPLIPYANEYSCVTKIKTREALQIKSKNIIDGLFIDCDTAVGLDKEFIKTILSNKDKNINTSNLFLGYRDISEIKNISWLSVEPGFLKNNTNKQNNCFVELSLSANGNDICVASNASVISIPEDTAELKKSFVCLNYGLKGDVPKTQVNTPKYTKKEKLSPKELSINGISLGMSFKDAMKIIGEYEVSATNTNTMVYYSKNGISYGFDYINGTYAICYIGLIDGAKASFVRGFSTGDSMLEFLNTLPGDNKPKEWAEQYIYNSAKSKEYARLTYDAKYSGWYNLYVKTENGTLHVLFGRDRKIINAQILMNNMI